MKISRVVAVTLALAVSLCTTACNLESTAGDSFMDVSLLPNSNRGQISVVCDVNERSSGDLVSYSGAGTFRIENIDTKPMKVWLPLLRSGILTEDSFSETQFSEFQTESETSLLPGESMTVTTPVACTFERGRTKPSKWRHALVFGVPSSEHADDYLSGTIVSQPVTWNILP